MQIQFSQDAFMEVAKATLPHVACLAVVCAGATLLTGGGIAAASGILVRGALKGAVISAVGSVITGCIIGAMENKAKGVQA